MMAKKKYPRIEVFERADGMWDILLRRTCKDSELMFRFWLNRRAALRYARKWGKATGWPVEVVE